MRLIDADDLIDRATNIDRDDLWSYTSEGEDDFIDYINSQPSVDLRVELNKISNNIDFIRCAETIIREELYRGTSSRLLCAWIFDMYNRRLIIREHRDRLYREADIYFDSIQYAVYDWKQYKDDDCYDFLYKRLYILLNE